VTADLSIAQRQSPLAMMFLGLRAIRSIGITQLLILVLFVFRGPFAGALAILPALAILVFSGLSALAWWRYTFQLTDGEFIVVKGVIRMNRLTVPIERIQSIAIDQPLLHRLTGLVKVTIDTAGSAATEFTIDAIGRPVAEELQRAVVTASVVAAPSNGARQFDGIGLPPPSPESAAAHPLAPPLLHTSADDRPVFTHNPRRLFDTAITMWPLAGLIVLGPLIALGGDLAGEIIDRIPVLDNVDTATFRWWFIPVGVLVFVLLSAVLNVVRLFLQDWQMTLRVTPTSLRRTSGLLSRTSTATSVARVQVISSTQNPLQQQAGLQVVGLSNVGEGDLSLPGCDDGQFHTVTMLAGSTPIEQLDLTRRVHPAQIWLGVRNTAVQMLVIAGLGFFVVGWWSTLAFTIVPIVWLMQRRHVRNFRWALGTELATFSRVIDTGTHQALLRKANSVRVSQTLFERRRGLGRVHLNTAAGAVSVGMLPISEACAVRDIVLHAAETDRRPWM
jgi:putative membrane protein